MCHGNQNPRTPWCRMVKGKSSRGHVSIRVCHTVCSVSMQHEVITSSQGKLLQKQCSSSWLFLGLAHRLDHRHTHTHTGKTKTSNNNKKNSAYTTKVKTVILLTFALSYQDSFMFLCLAHILAFCLEGKTGQIVCRSHTAVTECK